MLTRYRWTYIPQQYLWNISDIRKETFCLILYMILRHRCVISQKLWYSEKWGFFLEIGTLYVPLLIVWGNLVSAPFPKIWFRLLIYYYWNQLIKQTNTQKTHSIFNKLKKSKLSCSNRVAVCTSNMSVQIASYCWP